MLVFNYRGISGMLIAETIAKVRRDHIVYKKPIKAIARIRGLSRNTARKVLRSGETSFAYERKEQPYPKLGLYLEELDRLLSENEEHSPREQVTLLQVFENLGRSGYGGGYDAVRRYARRWHEARGSGGNKKQKADERALARHAAHNWMHSVLQGSITPKAIRRDAGDIEGFEHLLKQLYKGGLARRNRALCVLAETKGIPRTTIYAFLGIHNSTGRKYLEAYKSGGVDALYFRKRTVRRKADNEEIKKVVFSTLHEPPSLHGINRTTWKWDDLIPVLAQKGVVVGTSTVRQITKEAGFKWRKARIVLTSNDPEYREKLQRVQDVLRNLQADEAFFSIDEFGPFAVKMKGGRKLVGPAENFTVPQWQKSKGCLIMTAALELSRNQVTHFYSNKKNTDEMIRMMDLLINRYRGFRKLWLSWDAASWHMSKKLYKQIEAANVMAYITGSPIVDTAPLPAGAQFLNVIESVFSGLARGVIHNSDYKSVDEAKAAIDRYFEERNEDFQRNPKRAGKKIWGEERVVSEFHEANNCKDPRYR